MKLLDRLFPQRHDLTAEAYDDSLLDAPLLHLTERDAWTVRDAVGGCLIMGGIGSGKSSGPGQHLAMAYLQAGMGGLILAAKKSETARWLAYAEAAGRSADVVVFAPDSPWRFNPLETELSRSGRGAGYTQNVLALFTLLLELTEGEKKEGGSDPFWSRMALTLLGFATDVLHAAGEPVSMLAIQNVIQSCPRYSEENSIDDYRDDGWREGSYLWQCLVRAAHRMTDDPAGRQDLEMASAYLCNEFPRIPERTRYSIMATIQSMAGPFLRSPMREIFGTVTNLKLEDAIERGSIIIVDFPLKEFFEIGRVVGAIMKHAFQAAVERRTITEASPPCFLFIDEAQCFVARQDALFLATARESRCCTVMLTQNLPGMISAIQGVNAKPTVDTLLGNFMTKLWAANSDPETNEWAAKVIAQTWQMKAGSSMSTGQQTSTGSSTTQMLGYQVLPSAFTMLQKGGPPANAVETIAFQGGRLFSTTDATYARVIFPQTRQGDR